MFGFSRMGSDLLQICGGRVLVTAAAEEELGQRTVMEEGVAVVAARSLSGQAQESECAQVCARLQRVATGEGCHGCAEAESGKDDRQVELPFKPVESGQYITCFGAAVVDALAEACTAKVEAEHRQRESPLGGIERLHDVINNFVVHGSAARGVGVADERGKAGFGRAFIEQRFKSSRGADEIDRAEPRTGMNGWT